VPQRKPLLAYTLMERPPDTTRAVGQLGAGVLSIVLLCSIGIIAHRVIADDQWWHIATGRLILANHAIPDRDPFSFTYHGQRWVNWEWFFGVIVAALWDRFGISGLYLLRAITTGACVVATAAHMLRGSTRAARSFALVLLGSLLLCMQYRIGDRPHTVGFALLATTFLCGRAWLERSTWWRALGLFAMFLLWANTHPSFVYGLLVLGSLMFDSTVDDFLAVRAGRDTRKQAWTRLRTRVLQLVLIGSAALSIPHAIEHFQRVGTTLADPVSSEWTSIALHVTHGHPWMYAFLVQLALWIASVAVDRRAQRSALTLLIAALGVLAFVYSRFVVEFAIVASVVTYRSGLPFALRSETRLPVRPLLLQALLGLGVLVAIEAETRHTYGELAFGLDVLGNPVSQSDFMQKQAMHGRVFAPGRGDSAYLSFRMWPDVLIYIDGRVPQVYSVAFSERSAHLAEPGVFEGIVAQYDVDHVVIDKGTFSNDGIGWAERIEKLGGFALVYFDERGMVWTRERASGLACKSCRAFRRIKPWRTDHDWIVNEFRKQPFDEVWSELSYLTQITHGDRVVHALISTLVEDGGAQAPERERLKVLLASGTH
jgi:hypothetical protein